MPRIALSRFRDEVLSLYEPPTCAKNSWYKVRQVLDILAELGVKTTADLTPPVVARFSRHNPEWSPATAKGMLAYLSPVCKYAHTMQYVRVNPFAVRKDWYRAPEPAGEEDSEDEPAKHIPLADLDKLLEYLERESITWKGARLYALVSLVAHTGMRRNEALTRLVTDFDLKAKIVKLKPRRRRLKTEASKQPVCLPDDVIPDLEKWLPRTGSRFAFPGVRGASPWTGGPTGGRALDELQAAAKAAGIGHVTFQMFRHSWATHAELRGVGELMVQRQLRHTTKRTQEHYRHRDIANLVEAVEGFTLRSKPKTSAI